MITVIDQYNIKNHIYFKEDLEKLSTKQLIDFIRHNDIYGSGFWNIHVDNLSEHFCEELIEVHIDWINDNCINAYYWANEKELREILKTRPNIPNKQQRKKVIKDIIAKNKKNTKRNLKYQM